MDKAEALEFIGLKEPFNEEAVLHRYDERFHYFQMLYANAPNGVIEKIQLQNLEKLNQVKKILLDEITNKKIGFAKKSSIPPVTPSQITPEQKQEKPIAGWLIIHTESRKPQSFNLYEGVNYIGRKKKEDGSNNILILDDPYLSRTHAFIKCKDIGGRLQFELYDGDGSKPSINGVYLNGNDTRIHNSCFLMENDTIQVGTTKLVFKMKKKNRSITGELQDVMKTDFIRTIDIHK